MQRVPEGTTSNPLSSAKTRQLQPGATMSLLALIGIAIYVVIDVIAQLLPPHYNPISQAESDLAVGPYGYLMAINFVIRGLIAVALLVAIARSTTWQSRSLAGITLVAVWAIGSILLAFFPTDIAGVGHATFHGRVHLLIALIIFVCVPIGELLLAQRFAVDAGWQFTRASALMIAYLAILALILLYVSPFIGLQQIGGLLERLFIGLALLWMTFVTFRIRFLPNP